MPSCPPVSSQVVPTKQRLMSIVQLRRQTLPWTPITQMLPSPHCASFPQLPPVPSSIGPPLEDDALVLDDEDAELIFGGSLDPVAIGGGWEGTMRASFAGF